ncbi:calmodulin-regulated spectrin-associated protein 3 isoform X1 [Dermochelys coriacea]|uniref:calmodulin-regulated spectrin-associated protein 3 isoform X1 n=2 Tax=Dermochelys coriacea TaxID=27794 RepID=UPI0018E8BCD9|nr:calmodulin-regulated spectrin-associated protein 3 isoform X1 [Dermochelys coriacea]
MVAAAPAAAAAMRKSFLVPEIKPLDQYDFPRARSAASLAWALAKGYGGAENVPEELRDPFYTDQYEQEHIKPPVTRLLLSSDIYCRACRQVLPPDDVAASAPKDNAALLALLGRHGLAPTYQDKAVKEADLRQKPIKMGAHLAVIDSLMMAFAVESTHSLSAPPGTDLGTGSWEQKLLCWVDTVNRKLQESTERDGSQQPAPGTEGQTQPPASGPKCPTRWYWKLVPHAIAFCLKESGSKPPVIRYRKDKVLPKQTPCFTPVMGMKDLANGGAIAATIHYYCPDVVRLEDVCLKETMSVADSLYNLQLIQEFCTEYLGGCCPLALEDLLYVPPVLRINIGVFLAELFLCFEVLKPDFVRPKELGGLKDPPVMSDSLTPGSGNSNSGSPVFSFLHPLLPGGQPQSPLRGSLGSMHHSTSMSHVEGGFGKSWSKKQLSHPLSQAVSFSIPFGLDSDVDIVMGNPVGMLRSISSDSLAPVPTCLASSSGPPPEDAAQRLAKDEAPKGLVAPHRTVHKVALSAKGVAEHEGPPVENGMADGYPDLPTIEEALQIIHSSERLHPEGAADGFYLHSPEPPKLPRAPEPTPALAVYRFHSGPPNGRAEGPTPPGDGSLDSDAEDPAHPPGTKDDTSSGLSSLSSQPDSAGSSGAGVRMTNFAERKKKLTAPEGKALQKSTGESSEVGAVPPEDSPGRSPALSSEMSHLGARLEEKRRAIEAQKKRIEAIFAKHRQRLGKSAFLQLKCRDGGGEGEGEAKLSLEEQLARLEAEEEGGGLQAQAEEEGPGQGRLEKQVTFSPEIKGAPLDENLGDYNRAVAKLNTALSSLQLDMQRLSHQQQRLLQEKKPNQAWVIPAPKGPAPRASREFVPPRSVELSSSSPSPSRKPPVPAAPCSPQPAPKKAAPTPPKSPKHARPVELKLPPLTRVLTPPHNVDTLPHLRKFSPSQVPVQTRSSIHFSEEAPGPEQLLESPELETQGNLHPVASMVPQSGVGSARVSGDGTSDVSSPGERRSSLIEIPLSSLQAEEGDRDDSLEESLTGVLDTEPRAGLGFFFKDAEKPEDEMAQKRASLLERQQRRNEEARLRKQWLEAEKEQKEEAARLQAEERPRPEEEASPRRGDFTRQEYLRRHQLKLMEDLDKVLRQKPTTVRALKKGRPKTVFCDDSALARSPVKGLLGSRLSKVYSQSTLSLSTVANEPGNSLMVKRPSRAASPSGLMSPSRLLGSQSRERDWENASTASSPASVPEYTGPKLYKELSAKSNKHIIHNALSHCCLAGRVNEPHKNKILEEMEKSKAHHFLILFRDSSCQFRALYTPAGETEELMRLTGYGPRTISLAMIEGIYKYNSDRKRFTQIPTKTMSMNVDAITIQGHLWQTKKPVTPKKPGTPK